MARTAWRLGTPVGVALLACAAPTAWGEQPPMDQRLRVYVSGYHDTVTCLALDPADGALTPLSRSSAGQNPSFLAFHPSGRWAYAAHETKPGRVGAFAVDAANGALTRLSDASSGGDGPCHVAVHASGRWLFAANYGSGTLGVVPLRDDGTLGEPLPPLAPGRNAHQVLPDPSGRFVFVPCLGSNHVAQYRFDAATGALTPNLPPAVATAPKAGPRHLAFHPGGRLACLINELDSTLTSLAFDPDAGTLAPLTTVSTLPAGWTGRNAPGHVQFAPSGRFVYGSNRGEDALVTWAFDPASGALRDVGHETAGGDIAWPRDFTLDPTGTFLLVANQKGDSLTVLRLDPASGLPRSLATYAVPPAPACVVFAP